MYLVIDVGTHAVRAGLLDNSGGLSALHEQPLKLARLHNPSRVEQDPIAMATALTHVVKGAMKAAEKPVIAAGLACQRSSVVAWDSATGEPIGQIVSWQDVRGSDAVARLNDHEADIRTRSGLVLSPHYGASKLHWLQKNYSGGATTVYTPLVSYLIRVLTGACTALCDETNAGRTQLWNIEERKWDTTLAELFKVNLSSLPSVKPTNSNYGNLNGVGFPEVELYSVMGDQNAALLGAMAKADNNLLVNCGTGAFVLGYQASDMDTGQGLLRSVVHSTQKQATFALEGTVNGGGAALTWFVGTEKARIKGESWLFDQLPTWLANTEPSGLVFINTLGGLGSPYWRANITPEFVTSEPDVELSLQAKAVAIVESIVFLLSINIKLMQPGAEFRQQSIVITGGLSRLDGLCQKLANLCGVSCSRLAQHETTLMGIGVAVSKGKLMRNNEYDKEFQPHKDFGLEQRFTHFCITLKERLGQNDIKFNNETE